MDVSKQVIGSVLVHLANLILSMLSSGTFTTEPSPASLDVVTRLSLRNEGGGKGSGDDGYHANPCSFYLLNLGIDTTLGVVILIYALRLLHKFVELCPIPGLRTGVTSGYYGDPPKWTYWTKQASIYFAGLMIMKFIVWIIFALFPWLGRVGDFLLQWTEGNRRLQVFFVMFFFPLVMNAFQYYVIDSYIKHKDPSLTFLRDDAPIDDEPDLHHPRLSFNYGEDDSDSDLEDGSKGRLYPDRPIPKSTKKRLNQSVEEYNPDYDGANSEHQGSPEGYFGRAVRKAPTVGSYKSRNSSMMLLPGSRGPSTPGYADEDGSIGGRSGPFRPAIRDDDSTLVNRDDER
ncbi:hypothetical protein K440DRAFT_628529 [Wilcoxina mikolae CBS 423.85]|nr:hypothetical protein K440DRAFT_628529 [Wilcoxina mikolae CBS 423.85]